MSTFLPHDPTPAEAKTATETIRALFDVEASGRGHSILTGGELAMIEALRGFEDEDAYAETTARLLAAMDAIRAEDAR